MVEDNGLLDEFETLTNVNRLYTDDLGLQGMFNYEGNKVLVYWEPDSFTAYSSVPGTKERIVETFEAYLLVPELYVVSENNGRHDFEQVYGINYNMELDVPMLQGVSRNLGFCAGGERLTGFPEEETGFSVFSDSERFEYTAEVADQLHDVLPEIFGQDVEVLVQDITNFALGSRETLGVT